MEAGLSGVAGEYFVAAELSRQGYIATLTLKNTRGIDILVANYLGHSVGVQVKTSQGAGKEWILTKGAETVSDPNLVYVFVNLNGLAEPHYHVVPSAVVAEHIARHHVEWLAGTKRDGGARKDTEMRAFRDREAQYRDAWHLLGLEELTAGHDLDAILKRLQKLKPKRRDNAVNSIKAMFQFTDPSIDDAAASKILDKLQRAGSVTVDSSNKLQFKYTSGE